MTDTFEVQGDFAPVQSFDSSSVESFAADFSAAPEVTAAADTSEAVVEDTTPAAPNGFVKLGLASELVRAVADMGFTEPTVVQAKTIPMAMPREDGADGFTDLMVSSQTGSGKTAAFLLPVLHTLLKRQAEIAARERAEFEAAVAQAIAKGEAPPKKPKRKDPTNMRNFKAATPGALILCPTRELAQQVAHDAIDLVRHCHGLRVANVVGGMPYQLQIAKLQNADLVVATPGRLLDLQRSMQIKLDQVKFLVVDEADRMLDLGFSDDLAEVNQLTIERQQTMMFSATFAPRIQQLAQRVMREPQRVTIDSPQEKHANIKQVLFWADNATHKRKLLDHWLRDTTINQAIVFASTQVECDGLANDLQQDGFSAVALQSIQSGYSRIPASFDDSARMLGTTGAGLLARVHWPLLKRSVAVAGLLVFVDVMKELPATLVLRPFNSDTLAVVTYQLARDERLGEAALPALALVLVGLLPVALLSRTLRSR